MSPFPSLSLDSTKQATPMAWRSSPFRTTRSTYSIDRQLTSSLAPESNGDGSPAHTVSTVALPRTQTQRLRETSYGPLSPLLRSKKRSEMRRYLAPDGAFLFPPCFRSVGAGGGMTGKWGGTPMAPLPRGIPDRLQQAKLPFDLPSPSSVDGRQRIGVARDAAASVWGGRLTRDKEMRSRQETQNVSLSAFAPAPTYTTATLPFIHTFCVVKEKKMKIGAGANADEYQFG
nr:hypothetical protein Iba_chr08bCG11360 [Ipomoea batatas]